MTLMRLIRRHYSYPYHAVRIALLALGTLDEQAFGYLIWEGRRSFDSAHFVYVLYGVRTEQKLVLCGMKEGLFAFIG